MSSEVLSTSSQARGNRGGGSHSRGMRRSLRFLALGRPESPMRRWTPTPSVPRAFWKRATKGAAMCCSRSVGVPNHSLHR